MKIIGRDGTTIEFASTDGDDTVIDRRVNEDRRVFDHIVPERRDEGDRRAEPLKEETRKSTEKHWLENYEGREIAKWMDKVLSEIELLSLHQYSITHQDGTEESKCFQATASS